MEYESLACIYKRKRILILPKNLGPTCQLVEAYPPKIWPSPSLTTSIEGPLLHINDRNVVKLSPFISAEYIKLMIKEQKQLFQ